MICWFYDYRCFTVVVVLLGEAVVGREVVELLGDATRPRQGPSHPLNINGYKYKYKYKPET